jgi:hypothetical protein
MELFSIASKDIVMILNWRKINCGHDRKACMHDEHHVVNTNTSNMFWTKHISKMNRWWSLDGKLDEDDAGSYIAS